MSDSQHFGQNTGLGPTPNSGLNSGSSSGPSGLEELVQRIRAFSEPVTDSRQLDNRPDARPDSRPDSRLDSRLDTRADLRPGYRSAPLPIGPASNGARYEAYEDVRMSPPPVSSANLAQPANVLQPANVAQPAPQNGTQASPNFSNNQYRQQYQPTQIPNSPEPYFPQAPTQQPATLDPYSSFTSNGNSNGSPANGHYAAQSQSVPLVGQTQPATQQGFEGSSTYAAQSPAPYSTNHPVPNASATPQFGSEAPAGANSQTRSPASSQSNPASNAAAPIAPVAQAAPIDPNSPFAGIQRAINAVRSTLPLVQRLLPLLDGNLTTAIHALVAQQPVSSQTPTQQVRVDLAPIERGLSEVRDSQRELRTQVLEQITTFKRVEDQLERVREATDRNTLEQQELVEDLRSVGNRVSTFAIVGVVLLALLLGVNIFFLVQLQHILR